MSVISLPIQDSLPELNLALEASLSAGKAIMEIYNTNYETKTKDDDSPITEADLVSNKIIKEVLGKSNHYILSEEDKDDKKRLEHNELWIIDPLDGTSDFIDKTGEFTVMIALIENGKPVLGIINWPAENTIFVAQKGKGAYRYSGQWDKISVTNTSDLKKCKAVGSRHHLSDKEKDLIKQLEISDFTSIGSSLKVGKISAGEADVYLTFTNKMKEWDSAASNCIITEAGGKMTDMLGNEIIYNNEVVNHQNGILVTNGILHEKILNVIAKTMSS